jgi:hypothetical protein
MLPMQIDGQAMFVVIFGTSKEIPLVDSNPKFVSSICHKWLENI